MPSVVHLLLSSGGDVDELDDGSLLECLSFIEFVSEGSPRSLKSSGGEVVQTLLESVCFGIEFSVFSLRECLHLSEGDYDESSLAHKESLQEVSLDVGDLSVLLELLDYFSDFGDSAVLQKSEK